MPDWLDEILHPFNADLATRVRTAASLVRDRLAAALPRDAVDRHRRHPESWRTGHTADNITISEFGSATTETRKKRKISRAQVRIAQSLGPESLVVSIPWPWIAEEVGHKVGYRMKPKADWTERGRKRLGRTVGGTGFILGRHIVDKVMAESSEEILDILTGGIP
jgi:hypothetical protein